MATQINAKRERDAAAREIMNYDEEPDHSGSASPANYNATTEELDILFLREMDYFQQAVPRGYCQRNDDSKFKIRKSRKMNNPARGKTTELRGSNVWNVKAALRDSRNILWT